MVFLVYLSLDDYIMSSLEISITLLPSFEWPLGLSLLVSSKSFLVEWPLGNTSLLS